MQGRHDHARDPEEDDVEAGDQHRGRQVERALALERGLVGPAERRERHEAPRRTRCRARPRRANRGGPPCPPPSRARSPPRTCAPRRRAVGRVPGRDLVAPPELPRDAPVLDVLQPLVVDLGPLLGDEARAPVGHGLRAPPAPWPAMRTNHWSESIGSTTASERCERGCMSLWGFLADRPGPAASRSASTRLRASKRSSPR